MIKDLSLIEKLKTEIRRCPECSLEVRHPLVERCPRCFASLPRLEAGCQGCYHRFQCPIVEEHRDAALEPSQS